MLKLNTYAPTSSRLKNKTWSLLLLCLALSCLLTNQTLAKTPSPKTPAKSPPPAYITALEQVEKIVKERLQKVTAAEAETKHNLTEVLKNLEDSQKFITIHQEELQLAPLWVANLPANQELQKPWQELQKALENNDPLKMLEALKFFKERLDFRYHLSRLRQDPQKANEKDPNSPLPEGLVLELHGKAAAHYKKANPQKPAEGGFIGVPSFTHQITGQVLPPRNADGSIPGVIFVPYKRKPDCLCFYTEIDLKLNIGPNITPAATGQYKLSIFFPAFNQTVPPEPEEPNRSASYRDEQNSTKSPAGTPKDLLPDIQIIEQVPAPKDEASLNQLRFLANFKERQELAKRLVKTFKEDPQLLKDYAATYPELAKYLEKTLTSILAGITKMGGIVASEAGGPRYPYYYVWQRDAWRMFIFFTNLYKQSAEPALKNALKKLLDLQLDFFLESDLAKNPDAQRFNVLGQELQQSQTNADLLAANSAKWGEVPGWGDQQDGPAHALSAILNYLELFAGNELANPANPALGPEEAWRITALKQLSVLLSERLVNNIQNERLGDDLWEELTAKYHIYTSGLQLFTLRRLLTTKQLSLSPELLNKIKLAENRLTTLFATRFKIATLPQYNYTTRLLAHLDLTPESAKKASINKPDNLDASALGMLLHASNDNTTLEPLTKEFVYQDIGLTALINTFIALDQAFSDEYPLNQQENILRKHLVLWGRYKKDPYNGNPLSYFIFTEGNPWLITSLWRVRLLAYLAEQLPATTRELSKFLTSDGQNFKNLFANLELYPNPFNQTNPTLSDVLQAKKNLRTLARTNLLAILELLPDKQLSEQLDRYRGYPRGVNPLGWSEWELVMTLKDLFYN